MVGGRRHRRRPDRYPAAVARYLSPEWIAALDRAARSNDTLAEATRGIQLVIQQEVRDGPEGDTSWHLQIDDGSVRVLPGRAERADVVFTQDHATALAVGRGEVSAQTAFMVGQLRVGGNVGLLMEHHDAFDSVEDVFGPVRRATEY